MKLCKDCKHYERDPDPNLLHEHECYKMSGVHPRTGDDMQVMTIHADLMRMTLCGWDFPRFWQPKDAKS